ncbi:ACP S-malonyltransferase [Nocardia sp. NPDC050175]|uniref:ACP S-malonyltransferase n=1 Tax=Nocardia sp. NPDC050175 TaxID=3364317 RepID=UPI0037AF8331
MNIKDRPLAAALFPGMGPGRFADVGRFMVANPYARTLVAAADARLGWSLVDRYRGADGDYSHPAQIAFLVNCLALAEWGTAELGLHSVVCTGPSFGLKAAAVHAGALSFSDAVWLTAEYARCTDEYFAMNHRSLVTQSFVRMPAELLQPMLAELDEARQWYQISCVVDDDLAMITLDAGRLDWLRERIRKVGGLPLYAMAPPLHCGIFGELAERIADEVLDRVEFADPAVPIVADQDGTLVETAAGVRELLLRGVTRPVHWPSVVAALRALDVGVLHVFGPDTLFSRVGCTTRNLDVVPVNPRLAMRPRPRTANPASAIDAAHG